MDSAIIISRPYPFLFKIATILLPLGVLLNAVACFDLVKGKRADWTLLGYGAASMLSGAVMLFGWMESEMVIDPAARIIRRRESRPLRARVERTWRFDDVQGISVSGRPDYASFNKLNYAALWILVKGEKSMLAEWARNDAEIASLKEILPKMSRFFGLQIAIEEDVKKAFGLETILPNG